MMKPQKTTGLAAALLFGLLAQVAQAVQFYPISSASSSTSANDLWPVSNLIQGPGAGYDAAEPHDQLATGTDFSWVTNADAGFPADYIASVGMPVLTFDLGADVDLDEISTWGYVSSNANGASAFTLSFATEAEGPGGFGTSITFSPSFNPTNDDVARQSFDFGQVVTARYVEMTITDNFFFAPGDGSGGETPGGDRVGLGEVAFQRVPEGGSTWIFLGMSSLGLFGISRWSRRRSGR